MRSCRAGGRPASSGRYRSRIWCRSWSRRGARCSTAVSRTRGRPGNIPGMSAHEPTVGIIGLGYGRAHIPAFQASGRKGRRGLPARRGRCQDDREPLRRARRLRELGGHAGPRAARDRRDRDATAPASRDRASRGRRRRARAVRAVARDDPRRGAVDEGRGGARGPRRHDVVQLALHRRDARAARDDGRARRRPRLQHRRARARLAARRREGRGCWPSSCRALR